VKGIEGERDSGVKIRMIKRREREGKREKER
jgi:hypothetical protein